MALSSACIGGDVGGSAKAPESAAAEAAPQPPPPPPPPAPGLFGKHDVRGEEDERLAAAEPVDVAKPKAPASPTAPSAPAVAAAAVRAPVLIYTAQITMAVFEVSASLARVEAIARELGGFLAKRDDQAITIRVPAATFEEAVKRVEGVGDVLHRNVAAEDVTEEYRDLEVRLRSARAVQARLTELLAKATKVEDSLAIERELDRITGEIERIEGRAKFLRDQAAFSTITVRFESKPSEQVGTTPVRLPVSWLYDLNLPRLLRLNP